MDEDGIHKHQGKVDLAFARVERDEAVCTENKQAIYGFSKTRLAKGSSRLRVVKCAYCLRFLARWLKKPFEEATKDELVNLVGELENKPYAEYTKYDFKVVLKMFYKWLKGGDEEFPVEIKWLKPRLKNTVHKLPEELLSEEDVLKIVQAATNLRDKALVLTLYESGCRIGELLSLKVKNVQFDQYGAILRVTGKTGDRRVRVITSAPALAVWLENYSAAKNPDAPLWPPLATNQSHKTQAAEYPSIYVLVQRLARKAGIRKNVFPHLFRHSRATFLASKLTEAQMKEYFGWTQSSEMAATYVHLSGRDVDNALLKLHHLTKEQQAEEPSVLELKPCLRCRENNSPASKFCFKCGTPLDEKHVYQIEEERKVGDEIFNALMQNDEFKEFTLKKVVELGLGGKLLGDGRA